MDALRMPVNKRSGSRLQKVEGISQDLMAKGAINGSLGFVIFVSLFEIVEI